MFRIIVENQNRILIEGFDNVRNFNVDYISIAIKGLFLEIYGMDFYIDKLGEGYMQICGEITQIKYTPSKDA
jgi:hypothetical protein